MNWSYFSQEYVLLLFALFCVVAVLILVNVARAQKASSSYQLLPSHSDNILLVYSRHYPLVWLFALIHSMLCIGIVLVLVFSVGFFTTNGIRIGIDIILIFFLPFLFGFISNVLHFIATYYIFVRLQKQPVHWIDILKRTWVVQRKILQFTLIDEFVSFFVSRHNRTTGKHKENSPLILKQFNAILFEALIGMGWIPGTYFVMPVFIEDSSSVTHVVAASAHTLQNAFGHVIDLNLRARMVSAIIFIATILPPLFAILAILVFHIPFTIKELMQFKGLYGIGFACFCLGMALLMTIHIVMEWIFICLAYNYTQGRTIDPFDQNFIRQTFVIRKD